MDDVKPQRPWNRQQTGTTGSELDGLDDGLKPTPIEEMFPVDKTGSRLSLGNTVAHTWEEMDKNPARSVRNVKPLRVE